jgi:hypothetical protein
VNRLERGRPRLHGFDPVTGGAVRRHICVALRLRSFSARCKAFGDPAANWPNANSETGSVWASGAQAGVRKTNAHRMVTCPVNALTIPLFKRCQPPAPPTGLNGHLQITETLDRAVSAVGSVRLVAVGMPPLFRPSHPATKAENTGRICVGILSDKCRAFSKRLISGHGNLRKTKRTPQEIASKI